MTKHCSMCGKKLGDEDEYVMYAGCGGVSYTCRECLRKERWKELKRLPPDKRERHKRYLERLGHDLGEEPFDD